MNSKVENSDKQGKTWCVLKIILESSAQSQCVPGRLLLAPIYRWLGLEDPVGFDTDPSYMMVYNTTSLFDYDYTSTSILGLLFYGPLPKWTLGVLIQRALVVIPLSQILIHQGHNIFASPKSCHKHKIHHMGNTNMTTIMIGNSCDSNL
jgi:hypothetical protein